MLLFVGLGNPGPKYERNRHNIGFLAVDSIVRRHRFSSWRRKFHGELADGLIAGEKVLALKPLTYMNESGRAVGEAVRFYGFLPDEVVVFHDELDLPAGKLRMKLGGGVAGHNGLRSIASHIGATFHRVRLGIGHPGDKERVTGHVLSDFAKADRTWLVPLLEAIAEHAPLIARHQFQTFQNKVHLNLDPGPPNQEQG